VGRHAVKRWRKKFRDVADSFRLSIRRTVGPRDQSSPPLGSKAPERARTTAEMISRESMGVASRLIGRDPVKV
jgi:hypothetical protein